MLHTFLLLAQDAPKDGGGGGAAGGLFSMAPFIIMLALFFFLIVLPQQRRDKKQREAIMTGLKKNDEVVTNSGIIGIVTSIKEGADEVTLRSEDTRLRVLKSSIARILTKTIEEGIQDKSKQAPK